MTNETLNIFEDTHMVYVVLIALWCKCVKGIKSDGMEFQKCLQRGRIKLCKDQSKGKKLYHVNSESDYLAALPPDRNLWWNNNHQKGGETIKESNQW